MQLKLPKESPKKIPEKFSKVLSKKLSMSDGIIERNKKYRTHLQMYYRKKSQMNC